ncbi:MAG: hypothetical protein HYX29_06525 [Solirubrobacterales bacterium]|nr:hypothetical protein [Solirubrobacterales bacterium]
MSDGQFPSESPQDPANSPQASSENLSQEPGLAPIGASTPGEWPQNPDEPVIDVPTGGQYPDDMFGVGGDEAEISFPEDASSGGLADVGLSYGDGNEDMILPPPAEPQPLTELAMDPLPAPQNDAGGDMFSIDDLVEPEVEPAVPEAVAPAPLPAPPDNGDMFSIDDFDDDAAQIEDPAAAAAGGDMFSIDDLSVDEPVEAHTIEPLAAEPLASPEPLSAEPLSVEPLQAPEPLASPEPLAAPEDTFAAPEPISTPEPTFELEQPAFEPPPALEPAFEMEQPTFEPMQEVPADEPMPAIPAPPEQAPSESSEYANPPMNDRELVFSQPGEEAPPLVSEEIANPYAEVSSEADVLDPATGFGDEPDVDPDVPTQIVNPYAEVSTEAQVIDPAMALSQTEGVVEEAEHEAFIRSDPTIQPIEEQIPQDPNAPNDDQPFYQDFNTASSYGDTELPGTNRTESVAPPGMDGMVVGGLVVADGGKGVKKAEPTQKGKKAKRGSFGRGKKDAAQPQGEQLVEPAAMSAAPGIDPSAVPAPPAYEAAPAVPAYDPSAVAPAAPIYDQQPVAQPEFAQAPVAPPPAGPYAQPGESSMQPGAAKPKSFFGIKYGKAEGQAAAPKAAKAAKLGQKSFFGIKYGGTEAPQAPAPITQQPYVEAPAPQQPIAQEPALQQPVAAQPVMPAAPTAAKPKSFFGIKYGGTEAPQAPAPIAQQPVAPQAPAPVAQTESFLPPPAPYAEAPAQPYAEVPAQLQALVIESAESAEHAKKSKKRGMKQKAPAKVGQKSFFGIKYGGTVVDHAPPAAAQPQPAAMPAPVAAPAPPAYAPQQPVQAAAAVPTAFPGGYTADFASNGAQAPAAAAAAVPSQAPEQIMPPVAQTAQQTQLQAQPPGQ